MASKIFCLALAQMPETADLGRNLREIARMIGMASEAEADLIVFPECAMTGYGPAVHESSAAFDPDAIEAGVEEARRLAREAKVAVALGAHLPLEGGWGNSALLLGRTARQDRRYDKAHLYGGDPEFYRAGRARAELAKVKGVRVGMQICFDLRFPEPFRRLAEAGAQLIVVPAHIHGREDMWKGPVIEGHVRSRAAENGRFVAFVNAAGAEQNAPSMVADPLGRMIGRCRLAEPELLLARLDLGLVNDDLLRCRRADLYGRA